MVIWQNMIKRNINHNGFSLVELVLAIAVLAILVTIALPSFTETFASQRVKTTASSLYVSILRARSEAIKTDSTVTISPISGEWSKGWIIQNPLYPDITLDRYDQKGSVTISGPAALQYKATGRLANSAASKFSISAADTSSQRCISISLSGQPVSKKEAC